MMQVTYTLSQRDFFESQIAIRNRRKMAKWVFWISPILVCLIGLSVLRSPGSQLVSSLAPVVLFLLVWAYLLWVAPWLSARTQFLKQPAARGQRTGSFDGDGVTWQWDGGTSVVEWKTYIRWMESKNQILICSSPIQCGIV